MNISSEEENDDDNSDNDNTDNDNNNNINDGGNNHSAHTTITTDNYNTEEQTSDEDSSLLSISEEEERPYIPGCFEGPEKTLEVCFDQDNGHENGCGAMTRRQLDVICKAAKCTILTKMSNSYLDAYVLSESSLFVYKNNV